MEMHDDFAKIDEVSFGFYEQMDVSDMRIVGHLVAYVDEKLDIAIVQDDVNVEMDVIEDLAIATIVDMELYVHSAMDVIDLDDACDKKMNFLMGNVVKGFRDVVDVDLHDGVVSNMDLNLFVAEMLKDMNVATDVDLMMLLIYILLEK